MNNLQNAIDAAHYLREHCSGVQVNFAAWGKDGDLNAYAAIMHSQKTLGDYYPEVRCIATCDTEEQARTFVRIVKQF